jgi:hypothetical protein
MNRAHRLLLLMLAAFLALVLFGSGVPGHGEWEEKGRDNPTRPFAKLQRGMTPDQVRDLVGAPKLIARQILYHRYREQWVYDTSTPIRLTFDCSRGQLPQLLSLPRLPIEKTDRSAEKKDR